MEMNDSMPVGDSRNIHQPFSYIDITSFDMTN